MSEFRELDIAFIDLETTGLSPYRHEIIEAGIVIARQERRAPNEKRFISFISEHCVQLVPEHFETADPQSLKINKYHDRDWSLAVSQRDGLNRIAEILKDKIFIAQNVGFDWAFLQKSGADHGINFDHFVHYHKLDLASMAFGKFFHDSALRTFSLREMSEYFNVANTNAHTALSDARATFEICKKLLEM